MTVAQIADVEASLMRALTESESQYVAVLLERAESLLLVRISDLLVRVEKEPNFKAIVVMVEAEAVARVFRNPSAYRQETEGNYSYTLNFDVASGLLDILAREWERLGAKVGFGSVAPGLDGYLSTRHQGVRPDLHFQYGWGGGDQLADIVVDPGAWS